MAQEDQSSMVNTDLDMTLENPVTIKNVLQLTEKNFSLIYEPAYCQKPDIILLVTAICGYEAKVQKV